MSWAKEIREGDTVELFDIPGFPDHHKFKVARSFVGEESLACYYYDDKIDEEYCFYLDDCWDDDFGYVGVKKIEDL